MHYGAQYGRYDLRDKPFVSVAFEQEYRKGDAPKLERIGGIIGGNQSAYMRAFLPWIAYPLMPTLTCELTVQHIVKDHAERLLTMAALGDDGWYGEREWSAAGFLYLLDL